MHWKRFQQFFCFHFHNVQRDLLDATLERFNYANEILHEIDETESVGAAEISFQL